METISYKIKFIYSARFMASSLSRLVDNLGEGIHKTYVTIKCNNCKDCDCFLKYPCVRDNLTKYKCLSCNKNYWNKLDEELKKKFKSTNKFSNNDINKFILLLRKGVYPYEYMDDWEDFNEATLPKKEEFYTSFNMEEITDVDYMHVKRSCKDFEIKKLGQYHDLADVFENKKNLLKKL